MHRTATIGDLERAAGVTDRATFWAQFASIRGTDERDGKLRSRGLEAGIAELRRMAAVSLPRPAPIRNA